MSSVPSDCLFCRIVAGELPSYRVHADEHAVAFLDIGPFHRGHTLVVPRQHTEHLLSGPGAWTAIAPAVEATAALLSERLGCAGLNVFSSAGAVAGQEVPHLHVHVVPRYLENPGLAGVLQRDADAEELAAVHAEITGAGSGE